MGFLLYHIRAVALSACLPAISLTAAAPPEGLPDPPPLPPEVRDRVPMTPPPDLPDPSELFAQLKQLEELLSLSPTKLSKLRQTIEYIEKMAPDEREAMRIRLSQITRVTPALRQEIDQLAQWLPKDLHSGLSQFWLAASTEERDRVREQLARLEDPEKSDFLGERVRAFIQKRDEVFAKMRASLEKKREDLQDSASPPSRD